MYSPPPRRTSTQLISLHTSSNAPTLTLPTSPSSLPPLLKEKLAVVIFCLKCSGVDVIKVEHKKGAQSNDRNFMFVHKLQIKIRF